jgi:DNA-directed RNA polymerase specialized sigma24 family protein
VPPFRPRAQHELERLDDDALIAYMREAGAAGHESAGLALAMLAYGYRSRVRARVRLSEVPDHSVDELTDAILERALLSAFDGAHGGQFGSWMNTITKRAIADYFRRGPGRAEIEPLEDRDLEAPSENAIDALDALERTLAALNPEHRRVIDLWLRGYGAQEIDGVSDANVHQIVSRFRRALRGQLGLGPKDEAA